MRHALVSVIDTAHTVTATIPVGKWPIEMAFTPHGRHLYLINSGSSTASGIDTVRNIVTTTIPVSPYPQAVEFTSVGRAFVTHASDIRAFH